MVDDPEAASAGIDPFSIQTSISGCIGSQSLSVMRPNSFAVVIKWTKHELRSVVLSRCQNGSIKCEWYKCA